MAAATLYEVTLSLIPGDDPGEFSARFAFPDQPVIRGDEGVPLPVAALFQHLPVHYYCRSLASVPELVCPWQVSLPGLRFH